MKYYTFECDHNWYIVPTASVYLCRSYNGYLGIYGTEERSCVFSNVLELKVVDEEDLKGLLASLPRRD